MEEDGKLSRRGARKAKITIPGLPPSLWGAYGRVRNGSKKFLSPKAREWKSEAVSVIKEQFKRRPLEGRVEVVIKFLVKTRGRWDLDNREKLLIDSLTEANVWLDDQQIDFLSVSVHVDGSIKDPVTVVEVGAHE